MIGWVALGLSLVGFERLKEGEGFNTEVVGIGGPSLGVNWFKANVVKEKNIVVGSGLDNGPKQVWRIKRHFGVLGLLGSTSYTSSLMAPISN